MRTHEEFLAEAHRIESLGELFSNEHRRAALEGRTLLPRIIPTFLNPPSLPRDRWLEAEMIDGAIEYRLVETDVERRQRGLAPDVLIAADSAFDVLAEGAEIEEKEALSEKLAPIVERIDRHEFDDAVEPSVVQEIEAWLDAGRLDPAAQLRTRAEIMDFLAGEVEPSRFVAAVVEQRFRRATLDEMLTERPDERRIVQHF